MPDIEIPDILTINCNTIDTQKADRADKCNTSTTNCHTLSCEQHHTNMMQEDGRPKSAVQKVSISKSDNKAMPMVIDNENGIINYFLLMIRK